MITRSQLEASASERAAEAAAAAAVSKYRATRMPTFTLHKPTPDMYGLWDGFDFDEYDYEERKFDRRRSIGVSIVYLLLGMIVAVTGAIFFDNGENRLSTFKASLIYYTLLGTPVLVFIYHKANFEGLLRSLFTSYLTYTDNVSAYRANLAAWEFTNSECRLGYWQALRGVDFEHAVALLFQRRGRDVTITKSSGDGGVDLVLSVGDKVLWCQCKGHAKPVSVAAIREIAGVCSKGQATPVILAVNGYTAPAIAAADELGVICLDAPDLCNLARFEAIASVGEMVRGIPLRARAG